MLFDIKYLNDHFNNLLNKLRDGAVIKLFNNKIIIKYNDEYSSYLTMESYNGILTNNDYLINNILNKEFLNDNKKALITKYKEKFLLKRLFKKIEKITNINNVKMYFENLDLLECHCCNSIYDKLDFISYYKKFDFFYSSKILTKKERYKKYQILEDVNICKYCFLEKTHDELVYDINCLLNNIYCLN
jgi:hypothetical protein